jgi:arylsulfatase A-like enzyme
MKIGAQTTMQRSPLFAAAILAAYAITAMPAAAAAASGERPPNIVLILADDLGSADLGIYGSTVIRTPNVDALAGSGVRFTQGYVSHPVCSPSRAGLLTGRNQTRFGWEFNPVGRDAKLGMRLGEPTLADALRAQGYATGMIGKWHLGGQREYHPMSRGFDEYFGVLQGGSVFIDSRVEGVEYGALHGEPGPTERPNKVWRGFEDAKVAGDSYLTDVFADEAVSFIERHRDQPFFLYLSHTAPHTPLQATRKYLDRYRNVSDQRTRVYAAMVSSVDDSVGRVVETLKEIGQYENTLIVFASDNGCAGYVLGACSNAPLRGWKRWHHEGGVRIPFIVSWPAGFQGGRTFDDPVITLDLMATFTAAAGTPVTTEDSVDLLPYLRGEKTGAPHDYLYWRSGPTLAIRDGRWKLIHYKRTDLRADDVISEADDRIEAPPGGWPMDAPLGLITLLYDLANDPGESTNVASAHPDVVARLDAKLDAWRKGLVPPVQLPIRSIVTEIDGEWVQFLY